MKCRDQNIDTYLKIDRNVCPNYINLWKRKRFVYDALLKIELSSFASLRNYTRQDQESLFDLKLNWIDYENSMWYIKYPCTLTDAVLLC